MRLNRGQKTARNLILCGLLGALIYAMLGFPPYTVRGMLDRVERAWLLSDLEPLLVERKSFRYSGDLVPWRTTYVLARTGDTYVCVSASRHFLEVWPERGRNLKMSRGTLCTAIDGNLYVTGSFAGAASAAAEVTLERITQVYDPDTEECETTFGEKRTYTYPGEKVNDGVFRFRYRGEGESRHDYTSLTSLSSQWYRRYQKGDLYGGYGILHADIPVKVTLYGQDGDVLETLELRVDNYEFDSNW